MALTLIVGRKGRFKSTRKEFVITKISGAIITIRFRFERQEHELKDMDLQAAANDIDDWS